MAVLVRKFEPRLTRQSATGLDALAQKVDENLLMLKRFAGDITLNVNQVLETFNISPGGGAGAGGTTFDFGSDAYQDKTGVESWKDERVCDFAAASSPSFALTLAAMAMSGSGTGIVRVRVGGTSHATDGTVVAVGFIVGASFTLLTLQRTADNPGAPALLKLTLQSSAPGQVAQIKSVAITVR